MTPSTNPFKTALLAGKPQIGLWLSMASPYMAEVSATAGFDWLLIDGEHSPNDLHSTLAALQAIAPYRSHPIVRTVSDSETLIKQVLDLGAQTLLVPMIETAAQASGVVAATRYPPQGHRGVGSAIARASRWGQRADYMQVADDEVCVLVQAESATAMANLPAICGVDGVDGVFIGPADLAASMGHRGNPGHADVQAAIDQAIKTIVASGKAAGILTLDATQARHYLALGCTFVAVGVDLLIYAAGARGLAKEFAVA